MGGKGVCATIAGPANGCIGVVSGSPDVDDRQGFVPEAAAGAHDDGHWPGLYDFEDAQ